MAKDSARGHLAAGAAGDWEPGSRAQLAESLERSTCCSGFHHEAVRSGRGGICIPRSNEFHELITRMPAAKRRKMREMVRTGTWDRLSPVPSGAGRASPPVQPARTLKADPPVAAFSLPVQEKGTIGDESETVGA